MSTNEKSCSKLIWLNLEVDRLSKCAAAPTVRLFLTFRALTTYANKSDQYFRLL
jgi:hypothetical protein